MPITKNRNIITLTTNTARGTTNYYLDVNTGVLTNASGKVYTDRAPAGLPTLVRENERTSTVLSLWVYLRDCECDWFCLNRFVGLLGLADRLDSIHCYMSGSTVCRLSDELNKNFASFARWYATHNDLDGRYAYDEWKQSVGRNDWLAQHHLTIDAHFTEGMANFLWRLKDNISDQNIERYAYYLCRGLYEYHSGNEYDLRNRIRNLDRMCKEMGITPGKNNFMQEYVKVTLDYNAWKASHEKELFQKQYDKQRTALTFENADLDLCVVFPESTNDFVIEGRNQHNCVSNYSNDVLRGRTYVVFVRKLSAPTQSYITCEVRDGEIWQYYTAYNNRPTDDNAISFRTMFANHLVKNWVK